MTEEREKTIHEIEDYYQKSLTELTIDLTHEPIVRDIQGNYYRVMGVGTDCATGNINIVYKSLMSEQPYIWTCELCDFLSPIPEEEQEDNLTGQKRRFEFISDFHAQLDLIPTEDLLKALSGREKDILRIEKSRIKQEDYVLGRVVESEDGTERLYDVFNYFPTEQEAYDFLDKSRRNRKYRADCFKILHRVFYE